MDNPTVPTPEDQTQIVSPPQNAVPQPAGEKRRMLTMWGIAALVVVTLTTALFFAREVLVSRQIPVTPTPIPTATPTPTPIREPSALATHSAFLSFTDSVSLLSSSIQSYTVSDPSLLPPALELSLGFAN